MGFFERRGLRSQTIIFVWVSLIILLVLFGFMGNSIVNRSLLNTLKERQMMAVMAAGLLDEILHHDIEELAGIADSPQLVNLKQDPGQADLTLQDAFAQLKSTTFNLFATDEKGVVLTVEPQDSRWIGSNLSTASAVEEVLGGKEWSVSGEELSPGDMRPIAIITMPIRDQSGNLQGVLGGTIDLANPEFNNLIEPMKVGTTGHSQLVDANGIVLASSNPEERFQKGDHTNQFEELVKTAQPTVANCHNCHTLGANMTKDPEILVFAPLKNATWGVAIRQAQSEAFAASYSLRNSVIILGAGSMVIALLLSWVIAGRVVFRIRGLTLAAKTIASGDLSSPVPTLGRDEIGVLSQTFDDMRIKIDASQREIETLNEELERKVEARTRELSSLFEASKILTSSIEINEVLESIVLKSIEIVEPADAGVVLLYDPGLGRLVVKASNGFGREILAVSNLQPGEGIPGRVFQEGKTRVYPSSDDIADGTNGEVRSGSQVHRKHARAFLAECTLAVPLIVKGTPIGVLILVGRRPGSSFSESDVRLVESMCDQIAIAVENANLIKEADEARAIQQAERLKSEFVANISHELRTPLASIKGYTTTLLRRDANWDEESKFEFLHIVDEESDKLRELIDNLLEISKIGSGGVRINREPVLLQRVAGRVIERAKNRDGRHTFGLDFSPSFPVIEADERRVEQIIQNLVENAIKYSPNGGNISVGGKIEDKHVIVSVSDEGIGIPEDEVEKVFQRFYRVDNPTTRQTGGSGLGLSIVKWIVEAHGGEIWVRSDVGKGTSFFFSLPYDGSMVTELT